jgi:dienelactone hydrolase
VSQLTLARNNSFGHRIADFCRTEGTASGPDALARVGELPEFNGSAVAMGFCYGVPYAILGPKRLAHAAGISCHGIQMLDYLHELEDDSEPVCILWGDRDHRAPDEVLSAYRAVASRKKNVEVHIFPGVQHGYKDAAVLSGVRIGDNGSSRQTV